MIRNNPFLSSTRTRSTLTHSFLRAQPQYPPDRNTLLPEILYSTGPSRPLQVAQQLHVAQQLYVAQPRPEPLTLAIGGYYNQASEEIFPGPPVNFPHHDSSTMSIPDLIDDTSSPTTSTSSSTSSSPPRSSLSEISARRDYHFRNPKHAVVPGLSPAAVIACSDFSISKHHQLVQPIWSVDHEESKLLRQVACVADECARAPERKELNALGEKDLQDLKDRIISEDSKYSNGRDGHLSLSARNQDLEDAVAGYNIYGFAYTDVSNVNLVELIREFSPVLTVTEFMPFILAWVGPADQYARTKEDKGPREDRIQNLKQTIINEIKSIWAPSRSEPGGKRLLTRKEYVAIAGRLSRGGELSDSEIYRLLNTIRGLDMLELLGKCLEHELVVSTDVTIVGETLALHFCEDGYSFGLHTLFKKAGDKICRGNAEQYACMAVDGAAKELWLNVHSYEDREFHTRLGRMVDEYGNIQRKKYRAGAPKNRPDRRSPRADHRRQITFVPNLIYYL